MNPSASILIIKKNDAQHFVRCAGLGGRATVCLHDASMIDPSIVEKIETVYLFRQTSSRAIKAAFEDFWHLVFDDPSDFKHFVTRVLIDDRYAVLNVNDASYRVYDKQDQPIAIAPVSQQSSSGFGSIFGALTGSRRHILD